MIFTELWTALVLGLVGSLHCAGMCGPLALALPVVGRSPASFLLGRLLYNAGRLCTYAVLGLIFGVVGQFLFAGLQRWLSLLAGAAILATCLLAHRTAGPGPLTYGVSRLKGRLAGLLQQRSYSSLFLLGSLNGLLPCGLVYAACAGAVTSGGLGRSVEYMISFGFGTLPVMLGLGLAGPRLHSLLRFRWRALVPVCAVALGTLLILRGLALGIPYVSPALTAEATSGAACH